MLVFKQYELTIRNDCLIFLPY